MTAAPSPRTGESGPPRLSTRRPPRPGDSRLRRPPFHPGRGESGAGRRRKPVRERRPWPAGWRARNRRGPPSRPSAKSPHSTRGAGLATRVSPVVGSVQAVAPRSLLRARLLSAKATARLSLSRRTSSRLGEGLGDREPDDADAAALVEYPAGARQDGIAGDRLEEKPRALVDIERGEQGVGEVEAKLGSHELEVDGLVDVGGYIHRGKMIAVRRRNENKAGRPCGKAQPALRLSSSAPQTRLRPLSFAR